MRETTNLSQTLEPSYRPAWLRLINRTGSTLRSVGLPLANLSEDSLLSVAQRQIGLDDWGDESFRVPLRILLESLETEANLNFVGRYLLRQTCLKLLVNRLQLQANFKCYPEILQVPIRRPLFILGLPRTGSTFLHNLLSQDSSSRWLHLWELFSPSPPPESQTWETDPRIAQAEKLVRQYNYLAPKLASAHYLNSNGPEECNSLFEHQFMSLIFEFRTEVKSYSQWLWAQDWTAAYQYYRHQLQLLGWHFPNQRWVLKAPAHLLNLDALLTIFPDACIIQTHRNPLKVIASACSLTAIVHGIYTDRVNLKSVGEHCLNLWVKAIERGMQVREHAPAKQFYDVDYLTLVQDPIGTVRKIYKHFDYEFNNSLEENLKRWISNNPQHKHGIHRYSLEQFNLQTETVNHQFANYYQKFGNLLH